MLHISYGAQVIAQQRMDEAARAARDHVALRESEGRKFWQVRFARVSGPRRRTRGISLLHHGM